jgi:3-oxoacyl-[acyl-carrier protein] reductase
LISAGKEEEMKKLEGKVAVVTGASKGIGAGIAKAFGAEGASVVVNYSSSREDAERVVSEIVEGGGKATAIQADVSKPEEVKRLFDEADKAYGGLNVLVNNAGVFSFFPLAEVTETEYRRQFDTNVLGSILSAQEAVKRFESGGSIINISSVVSEKALPNAVVYAATKGAVDTITRTLSTELGSQNIRVNTIAPGGVETEGAHAIGMIGSDFEKQIVSDTPLGRLGQPDDIARVAVFLASDESSWLTGERITASGGFR